MTEAVLPQRGSALIPEATQQIQPTEEAAIDEAVAVLQDHAQGWVDLGIEARIRLLEQLRDRTVAAAPVWVSKAIEAKKIPAGSPAEGEEWLAGPVVVLRNIELLRRSLKDISTIGSPQLPGPVSTRSDGTVVAPVFPTDHWDKLMFNGFSAEVWMEEGVTASNLVETMGVFYRNPPADGKVALVLGAGNVSSIGPMDALYKLFVEGQVVLLKMNPVNAYLGPVIEDAFADLVRQGYLRVVYGGAQQGAYCCTHSGVSEVHITGSDKTHDAIVYGVGPKGEERKAQRAPMNEKPITSELGNVSPIMVVPGPWSEGDLRYHGYNLVSSLTNNAGFNCNATRVMITHRQWMQRRGLLDAIEAAFAQAPVRDPYYPGAKDRQQAFLDAHPDALQFGPRGEGRVPWTFISGLDPKKTDDICFTTEAWTGVTSEVSLDAADPVAYIEAATKFMNETTWGQLSCSIIVHPKSLEDPRVQVAIDKAIAELRYGSIAINHWSALSYALVSPTWGSHPGNPKHDIGSGRGVVHNTYLFDRPKKSVIRGPFKVFPKPAWFFNNQTSHEQGRKMVKFSAEPSWDQIPSLLYSALRG